MLVGSGRLAGEWLGVVAEGVCDRRGARPQHFFDVTTPSKTDCLEPVGISNLAPRVWHCTGDQDCDFDYG